MGALVGWGGEDQRGEASLPQLDEDVETWYGIWGEATGAHATLFISVSSCSPLL